MKILIVDDNEFMIEVLSAMLMDHEVTGVQNGNDAFHIYCDNLAEGKHFDFVLLGLELPGMDGIALQRAIWEKNPNQRLGWTTAYPVLLRPHTKEELLAFVTTGNCSKSTKVDRFFGEMRERVREKAELRSTGTKRKPQ